ncbi:MAG: HDOD domain-containing protein [Planctomycetota bacterium]|nr:HDOD domain-containing protein [Planctomycetota bacterium]
MPCETLGMADISSLIADIGELPTLPDVVARLNRLISDPKTSAADINDVISRDLALSAKILKLVNSPYYGFPRRITTITYAVVILGFNAVRNLALSASIVDIFDRKSTKGFDLKALWQHSIGAALAATALARRVEHALQDDAFTAALLHDIGKVAMNQFRKDDLRCVVAEIEAADCLFLEAEQRRLFYDHPQLGGALLEHWNLPPQIVSAVRCHHAPAAANRDVRLGSLVHLADLRARCLFLGNGGDRRIPRLDETAWQNVGLSWPEVAQVADGLGVEFKSAAAFFDLV